jgi:long-subunit acyl-CoA synthetase (AMP-forming)
MNEFLTAHQALVNWAELKPDREFLIQPVNGGLRVHTFRQAEDDARRMASALLGLGLQPGDKVAILAKNSAEWILADIAIAMAGLVSVPIYPTAGIDTISYIIGHSESRVAFVGKLDNPGVATAIPGNIPRIAFPYDIRGCDHDWQTLIESNEPLESLHAPDPEDAMSILYTSGSTGKPKGVVLSYRAYHYGSHAAQKTIDVHTDDRLFSYLPLAHITERTVTAGPAIYAGARCFFTESLEAFQRDLGAAEPTIFISVPRLWVKFQAGILAKVPPWKLRLLLSIPIIRTKVGQKVRREMGFDQCRSFGCGSAPVSPSTLQWYQRLGIDIGEGWGMTETAGLSCGNVPFHADRLGTIGVPMEGTELKITDNGELLIRCPGLFTEYYKRPELSREVMTDDGFFHTGDKAEYIESLGAYRITGRVKEIFKSAKGKYITPVPIEALLSANPLLEQICVMGRGLPAPVAVVVLTDAAQNLPRDHVETSLVGTLKDVNQNLESHECISHFVVVAESWTTENGLLTPTLKIKRDVLESKYSELIGSTSNGQVAWE